MGIWARVSRGLLDQIPATPYKPRGLPLHFLHHCAMLVGTWPWPWMTPRLWALGWPMRAPWPL